MIKITNEELSGYLTKKNELVLGGREITKKIEEMETERNKVGLQIQKLKDKIIPLVTDIMKDKLTEFEEVTSVELDGEEIKIETYNVVEHFKEQYLEAKNKPEEVKE